MHISKVRLVCISVWNVTPRGLSWQNKAVKKLMPCLDQSEAAEKPPSSVQRWWISTSTQWLSFSYFICTYLFANTQQTDNTSLVKRRVILLHLSLLQFFCNCLLRLKSDLKDLMFTRIKLQLTQLTKKNQQILYVWSVVPTNVQEVSPLDLEVECWYISYLTHILFDFINCMTVSLSLFPWHFILLTRGDLQILDSNVFRKNLRRWANVFACKQILSY